MSELVSLAQRLREELKGLDFGPPAACVYNPLEYAWEPYRDYLVRYGQATGRYVLLGMNPGPWGMAQTGVPFGEVGMVREWLGIEGPVGRPEPEHPKKPVAGFDCLRSEVSGRRLWGWARDRFGTPEVFFQDFFVANYCPLLFLEEGGRNLTPDKLRIEDRIPMFDICDRALLDMMEVLKPKRVIGVGKFSEGRARLSLAGSGIEIGGILHPSPASPAANRGWVPRAEQQLRELGVPI